MIPACMHVAGVCFCLNNFRRKGGLLRPCGRFGQLSVLFPAGGNAEKALKFSHRLSIRRYGDQSKHRSVLHCPESAIRCQSPHRDRSGEHGCPVGFPAVRLHPSILFWHSRWWGHQIKRLSGLRSQIVLDVRSLARHKQSNPVRCLIF